MSNNKNIEQKGMSDKVICEHEDDIKNNRFPIQIFLYETLREFTKDEVEVDVNDDHEFEILSSYDSGMIDDMILVVFTYYFDDDLTVHFHRYDIEPDKVLLGETSLFYRIDNYSDPQRMVQLPSILERMKRNIENIVLSEWKYQEL